MCGIVGYIGPQDALTVVLSGLEKLEYRGYDSAGVALHSGQEVQITRALGKLVELRKVLQQQEHKQRNVVGIGHTRWATHGRPSENNAHPHRVGRISLIHNGIIENYLELREKLQKEGAHFSSETDTEIAAHLLNRYVQRGLEPFEALRTACKDIRGSYAFLAIDERYPDRILVAKNATPIVIGLGDNENFVASDIPAVLGYTRKIIILEDGDFAEVTQKSVKIEHAGQPVKRLVQDVTWDPVTAQKGGYKHFMLKEINDQSQVIAETFRGRIEHDQARVSLPELSFSEAELNSIKRVVLIGCGSAWHACLLGKYYIEQFAKIPCEVDYASEYRYRQPVLGRDTLVVAVSQSGETADTLAVMDFAVERSQTLAICNVLGSSLTRKVSNVLYTHAGPEISVASTKAFLTQLIALKLLALFLAQERQSLSEAEVSLALANLIQLPGAIDETLKKAPEINRIAKRFHSARDFLYIGRGLCFPIALEGALKLKEISYIHAEGYPAGELKHGPIALIDEHMPVVVLLQRSNRLYEKILSNLREVDSRAAKLIVVTDVEERRAFEGLNLELVQIPFISETLSPVLFTIPLQLLAYDIAVLNGTDVDLPRNLAKSVTVE